MAHGNAKHQDFDLIRPIVETTWRFYVTVVILSAFGAWAAVAFFWQMKHGLGVTGLNRPVYWGFYITNFVFFIGISHAGTLISAILRLCQAEWRRPITRAAEVITVMVIGFGGANILMDMGRLDRALNVVLHPHFESPLLWDVCSISIYMMASIIYLYLPLIPDIAILRDNTTKYRLLYKTLALGWQGTPKQWHTLEKSISIMALIVLPVAVSVHTVVSWVFAMTVQPMWHSTIFGPFFVVGAIFSGIAALIVAMALIRKLYRLERYLKPVHFNNLGLLLLTMCLLWVYFTFAEYLTSFYGAEPAHMAVFWEKISGKYAFHFWGMVITCFIIPFPILAFKKTRTITGCVVASLFINIGMWLERYTIVVPTLMNPRLPYERGEYVPTWVEIGWTLGCLAMFALCYVLFTKLFPIISIWEIQEGRKEAVKAVGSRIRSYLPDDPEPAPSDLGDPQAASKLPEPAPSGS